VERKQWTCAVCRRTDAWGPGWSYYGSIRIDEECGHRVATCSDTCRDSTKAKRLVAQFDADHPQYGSGAHRGTCKAAR